MLWVIYALPTVHPHSMFVLTINGSGALIELTFVLLFIFYSEGKQRFKVIVMLLVEFAFVVLITVLVLTLVHTGATRSLVVGSVCIFFGTLMHGAPLSAMKLVITKRSVEYMPFFLSLATFANGICWTIYALIHFDLFIVIPNSLGVVFGLAQLILYAMFYKSTQRQIEARKVKGEMRLANHVVVVVIQDPQIR